MCGCSTSSRRPNADSTSAGAGSRCLVELTHLALAFTDDGEKLLRQRDRLFARLGVEEREPAHDLLRLRERTVGDGDLAVVLPDAEAEPAREAPFRADQ